MRYVSYSDRKAIAAMLKPIYTAVDDNDALMALTAFADSVLERKSGLLKVRLGSRPYDFGWVVLKGW